MTEQRQAPQPPPQPWFDPKTGNATEAFRRYLLGEFSAATTNVNSGVAAAQAAVSAAQATANAAQEQVNVVGAETLTFAASASPISATGSGLSGVVQTNIVTVTPAGGTGPYTYAWTYVSGDAVTVLSPSSAATKFSSATGAEAVYKCTVTDSLAATAVVNVGISIISLRFL
mgnify:CR=1 FL=1